MGQPDPSVAAAAASGEDPPCHPPPGDPPCPAPAATGAAASPFLADLNEAQRAAATCGRRHTLVVAGPGTGKTQLIVARAAFLIAGGTPAPRIQILTVARGAVSEILTRARLQLGEHADGLRVSTIHSWCKALAQQAPALFGVDGYTLIDRAEQLQLFKRVRSSTVAPTLPTARQIWGLAVYARATGLSLRQALEQRQPAWLPSLTPMAAIVDACKANLARRRSFDPDDLLALIARRLREAPEVGAWVAGQLDDLLIDELQDTTPPEWQILDLLQHHVTLYGVGDDAQAIYGLHGADLQNIRGFGARVKGALTLRLEESYRSTQAILDLSNWLIAQGPLADRRQLRAVRGPGLRPALHTFPSAEGEARWIADDLLRRHGAGVAWREHLLLVRSGYDGRLLEHALLRAGIPYRPSGGTRLLESAHVVDVLAALRVVANAADANAWRRWLRLWPRISDARIGELLDCFHSRPGIARCLAVLQQDPSTQEAARALARASVHQNDAAEALSVLSEALEPVLARRYSTQDWSKRWLDFGFVQMLAARPMSIRAFLDAYVIGPAGAGAVAPATDVDAVVLSTIHSAKGTKRAVAYVAHVSPGVYPSAHTAGSPDTIEEERRVLYVALTRARDELILTRTCRQGCAGPSPQPADPALAHYLLRDLPEGLCTEHRHGDAV